MILPPFAERSVRKDGDECEKGIRRSFSEVDMLRRVSPKLRGCPVRKHGELHLILNRR